MADDDDRFIPADNRNSYPTSGLQKGNLDASHYRTGIAEHIKQAIVEQERLGLDVLVHGEAERNDMVEYFGEHLDGFIFTQNGWVQSYGSRCVKPPVVIGDVSRPQAITVEWAKYAQSLTDKPVKGMLTGPVTILCWSFPREDVSRETIAKQIALALRDEVADLEAAGIGIIQIDEPALREGLPLKRSDWDAYLQWGVEAFRINAAVAKDDTQIHTTCVIASSMTSWILSPRWMPTSSPLKLRVLTWNCWSRLKSSNIRTKSARAFMIFTRQTYQAWSGLKGCWRGRAAYSGGALVG